MNKLRRLTVLGSTGVLAAALAVTPTAQAQPAAPAAAQTADAMAVSAAAGLVASRPAALHASASDVFVQHNVISSTNGLKYVPYDRTYRGLPVVGGDFVVATDSTGQVVGTSVAQDATIDLPSVTPSVTGAQAQGTARQQLPTVDSVGAAQLVTYALGSPRLAWESTVTGRDAEGPARLDVVVDALTGKVLHTQEHVLHDGNSAWNGPNPVALNTTQSGGTYSMKDPTLTNVSCQDAANNTTFSGPDDHWGTGNATSRETGCVDALFAAQTENKMLSQWLGRNSFDGNGGGWPIRVGLNDENAYYDGTQVQVGHNTANQWIGSIDVVAHEHGHGVDDHTPGGISGNGTQEFVADVFGASTEWFANEPAPYDVPDFLVGEQVNLVGSGPIRNMYNPSALGDKNCYDSSVPGGEVHASAGPGNHWFYLLAEGTNPTNGQPTSTTCNSSTVTGLGVQDAVKIFYNAMLLKTSASSYLKYRTWTLTAAKNLFPGSCTQFNTVKAAWDAISVPAQSGDPTCSATGTVTVSSPGNQSTATGTAVNLPLTASGGTAPYTWTATGLPAGLSINASTGTISGTATTAGTSNVTVTAKDSAAHSGTATFSWTVGTTTGCSGQKLVNPGFESGATGWTASTGVIAQNGSQQPAHGGTWNAWLDGYGQSHTDTLAQSVSIPAGCHATLTYSLHIDTSETGATAYDKLTVAGGSTTLASYSNLDQVSGYAAKTVDVSSFAGQTLALKFTGVEDASLQTSFVLDDLAVTLS
ncbi:M4 family metallopeptidase [Amycolatopsis saalfeldensis]|uniref:Zn-dependent metalloprotease n=1 Tax=Amycolatopsis saalfeldensis TaxID=394193 RepID=A0A1H8YG25_9PSEU|nr:M4 family metallopeptidase [Amycolatopsis saalfeldensis]SEP51022.1 Zn-dependent metalloprotease [Amycolatopsis saalfeldensis]